MRAVWITDIHMEFLGAPRREQLFQELSSKTPDVLFITGDIANATMLKDAFDQLATHFPIPIYFVLGNHDFYHGSIRRVHALVDELCSTHKNLIRLGKGGAIALLPKTGLLGHNGWGDGRAGAGSQSNVMLNDFTLIADLADLDERRLFEQLGALGKAAGDYFRDVLPRELGQYEHVYILTHVPPFVEACWHKGAISAPEWQAHFVCQSAGEAIRECAAEFPKCRITVLCGHTHSSGEALIDGRIRILTGGTEYYDPHVNGVFEI